MIASWGSDGKRLCHSGIQKCGNCKNWSVFEAFEMSKKIAIMFIPVAKYSKEYHAVCQICSAGCELTSQQVQELLSTKSLRESKDVTEYMWGEIIDSLPPDTMDTLESDVGKGISLDASWAQIVSPITLKISEDYQAGYVNYVADKVLQYLIDDDRPS